MLEKRISFSEFGLNGFYIIVLEEVCDFIKYIKTLEIIFLLSFTAKSFWQNDSFKNLSSCNR